MLKKDLTCFFSFFTACRFYKKAEAKAKAEEVCYRTLQGSLRFSAAHTSKYYSFSRLQFADRWLRVLLYARFLGLENVS
jgi:hypothetical protein